MPMATPRIRTEQKALVPIMDHEPLSPLRPRALSHKDYLNTLPNPSTEDISRIAEIQLRKENEISQKYHTVAERDAAVTIQSAYRGHRERRQMAGLTLDPSSRWTELIKELQFRSAIAPHAGTYVPGPDGRAYSSSELARINWSRAAQIAERASGSGHDFPKHDTSDAGSLSSGASIDSQTNSMIMDLRYFLEMIDERHRYGANLQIYWEEWQLSGSTQNFFFWLDHGDGRHTSHAYCDREKLERECIRYLSKEERRDYLVNVDVDGRLRWAKNNELITTSVEEYKDSMHGIVPVDANELAFQDESVKEGISESLRFNRKLAALRDSALDQINGKIHHLHHRGGDNDDTVDDDDDDDVTERFSIASSASTLSPEAALAHQTVTKDKTPRKRHHVSPATILNSLLRKSVRPGTWIYVADTLNRLYVGIKSSGAFQHTSFLAGGRITSAGSIAIEHGSLTYLSPLSGHYRPTTGSFKLFVENGLKARGVDLSRLRVSKAYEILLGMEYYGKGKEGLRRLMGKGEGDGAGEKKRGGKAGARKRGNGGMGAEEDDDLENSFISATGLVEEHWDRDGHNGGAAERRGLKRLMDDLHIKRWSGEISRGDR